MKTLALLLIAGVTGCDLISEHAQPTLNTDVQRIMYARWDNGVVASGNWTWLYYKDGVAHGAYQVTLESDEPIGVDIMLEFYMWHERGEEHRELYRVGKKAYTDDDDAAELRGEAMVFSDTFSINVGTLELANKVKLCIPEATFFELGGEAPPRRTLKTTAELAAEESGES